MRREPFWPRFAGGRRSRASLKSRRFCREPAYLRLTEKSPYTDLPKARAVVHGDAFVARYCINYAQKYQVFYEVLDMPLEELEKLRTVSAKLVKANMEIVKMVRVRLPPESTAQDLLDKVRLCRSSVVLWCRLRSTQAKPRGPLPRMSPTLTDSRVVLIPSLRLYNERI